MTQTDVNDIVNWHLLEDPNIIEKCQNELKQNGVMVINEFATTSGLERLRQEIIDAPYNEVQDRHHTPWQDQGDFVNYPEDHPRNFFLTSSVAFVGRQTLEQTSTQLGISMYTDEDDDNNKSNRLLQFVSKVSGKSLYRSNDENGSVYSYRIHSDHTPNWHFDESHYTAILYLVNNGEGGEFMLVPWCRPTKSKDDVKGHEIVREVCMDGNLSKVKSIQVTPGTLVFFSGAHCFHRAARLRNNNSSNHNINDTEGEKEEKTDNNAGDGSSSNNNNLRLGLVFTYFEEEGYSNSDSVKNINKWDPDDFGHVSKTNK